MHDELVVQASLSLVASVQAENVLHVPLTLSVPVGVKAQTTDLLFSIPPPLQAVIVLYVEQAALAIQLVPLDTHYFPEIIPVQLAFEVPPVISSHYLTLQTLVPVVAPIGNANMHSPSVPL